MTERPDMMTGAIVRLNSGGPKMTVDEVRNDGFVMVAWFAGDDLRQEAFPADMLTVEHAQ